MKRLRYLLIILIKMNIAEGKITIIGLREVSFFSVVTYFLVFNINVWYFAMMD